MTQIDEARGAITARMAAGASAGGTNQRVGQRGEWERALIEAMPPGVDSAKERAAHHASPAAGIDEAASALREDGARPGSVEVGGKSGATHRQPTASALAHPAAQPSQSASVSPLPRATISGFPASMQTPAALVRAGSAPPSAPWAPSASAPPEPPIPDRASRETTPAFRVSVHDAEGEVRVWMRDRGASESQGRKLAHRLLRLFDSIGRRLVSLTLNGRVVHEQSAVARRERVPVDSGRIDDSY